MVSSKTGQKRYKTCEFMICAHSNEKRMAKGSAMRTLKFSSETESAGQEGFCSHATSITFSDRIIPFLPGTAVKRLFIVSLSCSPPK